VQRELPLARAARIHDAGPLRLDPPGLEVEDLFEPEIPA
jgi:hypothetical protein